MLMSIVVIANNSVQELQYKNIYIYMCVCVCVWQDFQQMYII